MKKWLVRISVALDLLLILTIGGACAVLSMMAGPADVPGVPRDVATIDKTHSVSYIHAGDANAPRIIFVHGSPGSAAAWTHYLTDPIPGFESIAIDRFGFGKSAPNKPVSSLAEQAKAIEPFLVERDGKWPILVGHSLGGSIICEAAADFPDKVGGLVILAGALSPDLEKIHWYQRVADFWFVPSLLPAELTTSNRELLPLKSELTQLAARLGSIKCPVAIIHGENDMLVPFANVAYMKENIANDRIVESVVLPHENHFLPWTVESTIRGSIEKLSSAN